MIVDFRVGRRSRACRGPDVAVAPDAPASAATDAAQPGIEIVDGAGAPDPSPGAGIHPAIARRRRAVETAAAAARDERILAAIEAFEQFCRDIAPALDDTALRDLQANLHLSRTALAATDPETPAGLAIRRVVVDFLDQSRPWLIGLAEPIDLLAKTVADGGHRA